MIPNAYYDNIFEIDYQKLKKIGVKNIFFDIDNTIVPYKVNEVNKKTIKLFKTLKKDFNIYLFSNSRRKRTMSIAKELDVGAYYFSMKPLKKNYKKILNIFKREECVFVGDILLTDVLGAKRNRLKVIYVNRLNSKEPLTTKFWRLLEKHFFKKYNKQGIFKKDEFYDRLRNV